MLCALEGAKRIEGLARPRDAGETEGRHSRNAKKLVEVTTGWLEGEPEVTSLTNT